MAQWMLKNTTAGRFQTPRLFSVEGLIGAGKSTLIRGISESPIGGHFRVQPEDLDVWRAMDTPTGPSNILAKFYAKPGENAYLFQNLVMGTMANRAEDLDEPDKYRLMDRSIHSGFKVFAKMLFDDGLLSSDQFGSLGFWYNHFVSFKKTKLWFVIYLDIEPEVAYARIQSRGREEEKVLSLDYLRRLRTAHEEWLAEVVANGASEVIRLNGNGSPEEVLAEFMTHRRVFELSVHQLSPN